MRALRDGRFKLIDAPRPELYDLDRDPFEERNLYDERPATAAAMTRRLQVLARSPSATGRESPTALPPHVTAELAALGYVGSRAPRTSNVSEPLPDPKDCIGLRTARDRGESLAARTVVPCSVQSR